MLHPLLHPKEDEGERVAAVDKVVGVGTGLEARGHLEGTESCSPDLLAASVLQ